MQDVRYAIRTLVKQPMFTLVASLTLTLGIGANTAIFSLLYQVLLRPLPYADAERLVFVWNYYPLAGADPSSVSIPDYLDRRTQAPAIEEATLFTERLLNISGAAQPEQLRALAVTPSFFSTLGRQPLFGRAFTSDDARPEADRFAILTHDFWQSRFGADRAIVGHTIRINSSAYEVVGVLPADFELPLRDVSMLVPFAFTSNQMSDQERGNEFSTMIARLRVGATIAQADAQMKTIVERTIERMPGRAAFMRKSGFTGRARPIRDQITGDIRTPLYLLQAGVLLVLLIACANVANLLLMRATGRQRELAIRATLGAGRWRLVRQLVTESLVLALIGASGGLAVGLAGVRALIAMAGTTLPGHPTASLHPPVLLLTIVLAVATGILFGLAPALPILRETLLSTLKDDTSRGSAGAGTNTMRMVLVAGEVALALILLVGAGLLVKSFARVERVDPGFSTAHVLTAQLTLPATRYPDANARRAFWLRLLDRARSLPGVSDAGLTGTVPFSGNDSSGSYSIAGRTLGPTEQTPHARQEVVGGDYFRAVQIPLGAGRVFNDGDTADSPRVVIVDQYLVNRQFPGRDALSQQIQFGGPSSRKYTIVGVVGTINGLDLGRPVAEERIYFPATQIVERHMAIVLKTNQAPEALVAPLRRAVQSLDPEQPIADVIPLNQWVARSLGSRRTPTVLLSIFSAVALALSSIGLYGVLAFAVLQRGREFGIRQALGADRRAILSLVLTDGLRTAGAGVVVGLMGSVVLTRYLRSLLFGVTTLDLTVIISVTTLLLAVAAIACYLPARRATRIDPMVALRES